MLFFNQHFNQNSIKDHNPHALGHFSEYPARAVGMSQGFFT
jgi:hypothetical protein